MTNPKVVTHQDAAALLYKHTPQLVIIRGAPGSGKTTFAETYLHKWNLVEADQFFTFSASGYCFDGRVIREAHKFAQERTKMALLHGLPVVVANTFTREWEVRPYLEMCRKRGIGFAVVHMLNGFVNKHGVHAGKIQQMRDDYQPTAKELKVRAQA